MVEAYGVCPAGSEHPSQHRLDKASSENNLASEARQASEPPQSSARSASPAPPHSYSGANGDAPAMPAHPPRKAVASEPEAATNNGRMWMANGAQHNAGMGVDYLSGRYQGMSMSGGPPESGGGLQRAPSQDGNAWGVVQQRTSSSAAPQGPAWGMRPPPGEPPPRSPSCVAPPSCSMGAAGCGGGGDPPMVTARFAEGRGGWDDFGRYAEANVLRCSVAEEVKGKP
eukprot:3652189-Pyramimonas_sp.AAC.1